MVSEVILHVGHGKTGSSYIQSALAISADKLLEYGIHYPVTSDEVEKSKTGKLTSGNFKHGDSLITTRAKRDRILLSSESLFHPLWDGRLAREVRTAFPEQKISILMFVRNPVSNAASSYLQAVQKGMEKHEFSRYLDRFNRPKEAADAVTECRKAGFDVKIANFSDCRSHLLEVIAEWLGIPNIDKPRIGNINRSISTAEAELLLRLNQKLPRGTVNPLGSRLCAELPDIKSCFPTASREAMKSFIERMEDQTNKANKVIGKEIYKIDFSDKYIHDSIEEAYSFNVNQIEIISDFVARLWKKLL